MYVKYRISMILVLIVGWFYAVFLVCLVPCLWHVLWPQLGGIVAGGEGLFRDGFGSKTSVYWSCQGALWHAGEWKSRCCVAGCILGYAIAWDSTL